LIAIAALLKHHVSYPKGGCTKDQKAKNTHLAPPPAVADAQSAGRSATLLRREIGAKLQTSTGALLTCNLYSITTNQAAIIALFRVVNRYVGNLPPMPGIFPDYPAPVVRNSDGERELVMMRWGMPPPPRTGGPPVTNIRNTSSPHWRGWLKPESRCLVPFNSFAEYAPEPNPETKKKDVVWFALNGDRPPTAFAGIGQLYSARVHPREISPYPHWAGFFVVAYFGQPK
jgi:hypothetical protein